MDDRSKDQFHRESHLAAVHHNARGTGHEGIVDHAEQIVEINPPFLTSTLAEVNDHKAFIGAGNVPADEGIGGVNCWHPLEIDVGATGDPKFCHSTMILIADGYAQTSSNLDDQLDQIEIEVQFAMAGDIDINNLVKDSYLS